MVALFAADLLWACVVSLQRATGPVGFGPYTIYLLFITVLNLFSTIHTYILINLYNAFELMRYLCFVISILYVEYNVISSFFDITLLFAPGTD